MLIHFNLFRHVTNGSAVHEETCEACGQPFRYTLTRQAQGVSVSLYWTFMKTAKARAQKDAEKRLARMLRTDADLVPCPKCRHVNQSLIAAYRSARYRGLTQKGFLLLGTGVVAGSLVYPFSDAIGAHPRMGINELAIACAAFPMMAGLALLLLAYLLRSTVNPNRRPGRPDVPIGTPPAEMPVKTPNRPYPKWVAVPSVEPTKALAGQWAFFRAGQLIFPPLCCQCLGPPDGILKPAIGGKKLIAAPICRHCQRRITHALRLATAVTLVGAVAIGLITSWRLEEKRGHYGMAMGIAVGTIAFLIGLAILQNKPNGAYRLKFADISRGVLKIRFANPAYTALIIRDQAEKDAIVPLAGSVKTAADVDHAF